jgi:hypothetical protein
VPGAAPGGITGKRSSRDSAVRAGGTFLTVNDLGPVLEFARPSTFSLVEELPRTATGKVKLHELVGKE